MNIKILGTGCPKCHKLAELVKEVIAEMELDAEVEEVEELTKILEYPILTTPGLVIDEKVVLSGQVPSKEKLVEMFRNATV